MTSQIDMDNVTCNFTLAYCTCTSFVSLYSFCIIFSTDQIILVLPTNDLINEDDEPTMPFKLATGTKPLISHLRVLFCPCVVRKDTEQVGTKALNMRHQAQMFLRYLGCNPTSLKRVSCLCTTNTEENIFVLCYF